MFRLEDIALVPNLDTRAYGGTVVYPGDSRVNFKGGCFLPMSLIYVHSLEDMKLVPNLATRVSGGTLIYPNTYQGILGGF